MNWRAGPVALTAAALVAIAVGCAGTGGDKAGGNTNGNPLVLTLESEEDLTLTGAPEFAAAVDALSGGEMRIQFVPAQRGLEIEYEKGVVQDVRAGKAQLGIVGARVWDTLGVKSFQALLAPLLVDSYELEQRVLESPQAAHMLDGVEGVGVVGIALLPGPLRRPLGMSHPLRGPADYRGAKVGIRPGKVAQATLLALGGTAKGYVPGELSPFDAAESDPKGISYNGFRGALTTNVVLWPKPFSIIMNRHAFDALDAEQQKLLRDAGRKAIDPELRQTILDEAGSVADACRRRLVSLVTASAADLASLRRAVQPVYDELAQESSTRQLVDEIQELRGSAPAATLPTRCAATGPGGTRAAVTPLDGRWTYAWTREELLAAGMAEKYIPKGVQRATVIVEFSHGRYTLSAEGKVRIRGTYTVDGDVMNLVHTAPAPGYAPGQVYRHRWSIYRGQLRFGRYPGSDYDLVLLVKPFTRVR